MKSMLIMLMMACVLTAAMVPRERRALNSEEDVHVQPASSTTTGQPHRVCIGMTPCGWSVYKSPLKVIEQFIENSYCICSPELSCESSEDDSVANAYVHRCKPPKPNADSENTAES